MNRIAAFIISSALFISLTHHPVSAADNQTISTDNSLTQTSSTADPGISPKTSPGPQNVDTGSVNQKPMKMAASTRSQEAGANALAVPNPILATGSNIHSDELSPNAMALANQLGLLDTLKRLPSLKESARGGAVSERLALQETRENVSETLRGAEMDVNYVLAEIYDEQGIYNELLGSYDNERDKLIAKTNAISFGTNGALWAVCEALAIPTATRSHFAVSSGITGILAGVIPSIASAITLKEVYGRRHSAPAAPNMLAKMFDRPTNIQNDFPKVVWDWLNSNPAEQQDKRRRDLIIDRWVADSNIPSFTDRGSQSQIDTITASKEQVKSVTIGVLSARLSMLSQLASEVSKMNRLLNELEMALRGQKHA